MTDVYESAMDGDQRYGAAFERDDETSYFYLLDLTRETDQIIEAFNAYTINDMSPGVPIAVRWSSKGDLVGLLAGSDLVAVFDLKELGHDSCGRWATADDQQRLAMN